MLSDDQMKKQGRGSIDEWQTSNIGNTVSCVKWYDNKSVHLLSTFLQAKPINSVKQYHKKHAKNVDVLRPAIVKHYNKNMRGVDLPDMLLALYRIDIKSRKFYHRLIFHLLDICVTNSWILYRQTLKKNDQNSKHMPLIYFKMLIVESLLSAGKSNSKIIKIGRPSSQSESEETFSPKREKKTI